jgi:uncharacterized OsmC-like protein
MSTLGAYLLQKRAALEVLTARALAPGYTPSRIAAHVSAEGRSGVRRIRIRDFQFLSDSPTDFAGYDLGPSSPEIQLGVLGSCITHTFLIQAARLGVEVESLDVEVSGRIDARAGKPGHDDIPVFPHAISYRVHIASAAPDGDHEALHAAVEKACPILNLLRQPQPIEGCLVPLPRDTATAATAETAVAEP